MHFPGRVASHCLATYQLAFDILILVEKGCTNRLTTKRQHQGKRNLVAYTGHNHHLDNALIRLDEPAYALIRC